MDDAAGSLLGEGSDDFFFPAFFFRRTALQMCSCFFRLAQDGAVQALHHCLLLRDASELQVVKVPRQSEESAERVATETAKRHHPPVD